jgi:hypothetical protein
MTAPTPIDLLIERRLRCLEAMRANVRDEAAFNAASRLEAALAAQIRKLRAKRAPRPLTVHPYFQTHETVGMTV